MVWMNIDIPTRRNIIHSDTCVYVLNKKQTPLKGIGRLRRDGGWLPFNSAEQVECYSRECLTGKNLVIHRCKRCF